MYISALILNDYYYVQFKDSKDAAPSPRTTGSLVAHHDDLITRMKNIEMIELGGHRIRPWYFSPYPQVRDFSILFFYVSKILVFAFRISYKSFN